MATPRRIGRHRICDFARRVAEKFRPDRIILFGSYARGKSTPDSDVDLLVILSFKGRGVRKAIEILTRVEPGFPVDLIVRTPRQMKQRLAWGDFFLREVVEHGKVLYEASRLCIGVHRRGSAVTTASLSSVNRKPQLLCGCRSSRYR
jgi:predicted nucleotidyltransferase